MDDFSESFNVEGAPSTANDSQPQAIFFSIMPSTIPSGVDFFKVTEKDLDCHEKLKSHTVLLYFRLHFLQES